MAMLNESDWECMPEGGCDDDSQRCENCDETEDNCDCCRDCGGAGCFEDGGCGGGCDYCRPFPRCEACRGTGKVRR